MKLSVTAVSNSLCCLLDWFYSKLCLNSWCWVFLFNVPCIIMSDVSFEVFQKLNDWKVCRKETGSCHPLWLVLLVWRPLLLVSKLTPVVVIFPNSWPHQSHRSFKIYPGSASTWMRHLVESWLGPVLSLPCGLWPSFQTVQEEKKTGCVNRSTQPICPGDSKCSDEADAGFQKGE